MRKLFLFLILWSLALISCEKEEKLAFAPINYLSDSCANCPKVKITIPNALEDSKISKTINNSLKEEIIYLLTFEDGVDVSNIEDAIASFKNGYDLQKSKFPDETIGWEAKVEGEVAYEDENLVTIQLKSYIFTGGAHGYAPTRFLNFDKKKGLEMENLELFKDQDAFLRFAETKFRIQEQVPMGKPINSTGFMFDNNMFYLSENIGFTKDGLQLFYDQYEVASYADGPIVINLPFEEIKEYMAFKFIKKAD
ncbi:DUF3298 and DUF4163 domain-containing protein [Sediminicola sp. 1XM1-17]|uniref:DUF3298 and DUF4163 domain-containing protein n=1 Tax=Sediminicola sp. 1XM1-17 TaxID=3127702 RepID=UPI0030788549